MKNKKKLFLVLGLVFVLFALSGCTAPVDENNQIIQITSDTTFKMIMDTESWFSAFFVYPLSKGINYLTPIVGVGLAITIVTVLVNTLLAIVTLKSTVQQQQLQLMQPEMQKIQKKYEGKTDDASRMRMGTEMQQLYSKYNVNPFGALFAMFLQFPIIIAMYQAVQRAESVTYGTFLGLSLETTPWDGILKNGQFMYLILFIIMIVAQLLSMKVPMWLAENKAKKKAEKEHRRYEKQPNPTGNTMYFMMVPILILSIMWPAAMTVYWTISSLTNIAKTLIVQTVVIDRVAKKG